MRTRVATGLISGLWILLALSATAQVKDVQMSSWFGLREITSERFAPGDHLDFMDYLDANEADPEDEYLGFAMLTKFTNHMELDIRFTLNSGWGLSGYNLKIKHFPARFIGLSAGILRQPFYFRHYDDFLIHRDQDYYIDLRNSTDQKYHYAADQGWMVGLVFPVSWKALHLTLQFHGGLATIRPFREEFGQKLKNSNFRRDLVYNTNESYNWFFFPEAAFSLDLFRIGEVRIGVQAQASWYVTNKYIDYRLTTYNWTYDSPETIHVESPRHRVSKVEYDVGLVFRF